MILPIVTEPNPVLHQKTTEITEVTPEIITLAANMRETMHNAEGIGLAAPQIGQLVSMCVLEMQGEKNEPGIPYTVLINPRITWKSTKQVKFVEACLSILGIEASVVRPEKVRVKARNLQFEHIEIEADGIFARALQHEIDHLNGVLFTSYVSKRQLEKREIIDYPRI